MIKAVVFDLDDTLFPETDYVKSGYRAVAEVIKKNYGICGAENELTSLFNDERTEVFNRYLQNHGLYSAERVDELIVAYRLHIPDIKLSGETESTLVKLRNNGYKLGIITDGRPEGQRNKISALGLADLVDEIIITDELGGAEFRKPNPASFVKMADKLGVDFNEMVYVGDNPQKDFAVKKFLPIMTVQIVPKCGLYKETQYLYAIKCDKIIETISRIEDVIFGVN